MHIFFRAADVLFRLAHALRTTRLHAHTVSGLAQDIHLPLINPGLSATT
jgi:hypothetical protein